MACGAWCEVHLLTRTRLRGEKVQDSDEGGIWSRGRCRRHTLASVCCRSIFALWLSRSITSTPLDGSSGSSVAAVRFG